MKKERFSKKLLLNKETITSLADNEMDNVRGGDKTKLGPSCESGLPCCNNPNAAWNKTQGAYCNSHRC